MVLSTAAPRQGCHKSEPGTGERRRSDVDAGPVGNRVQVGCHDPFQVATPFRDGRSWIMAHVGCRFVWWVFDRCAWQSVELLLVWVSRRRGELLHVSPLHESRVSSCDVF